MTKNERREAFDECWQSFYREALSYFDGFLHPGSDGVRMVKDDAKRLKALFKLLQKGD